jgi:hypothetical protein
MWARGLGMSKSAGREGVRLWFEFVKRAHDDKNVHVDKAFYKPWGDYPNQTFNSWWKQHAETLFQRNKVELVQRYLSDAELVKVSVPMSLTATEAANQLRDVLIEHYKAIGHVPHAQRSFALTEGVELRISAMRAYLHTYDIHQQLLAEKGGEGVVSAKELLARVRVFYSARTLRWQATKRKVEALPMALAGDFKYNSSTKTVSKPMHDDTAIRNIRRYLSIAQRLVENAAKGEFPGKDFNR